MASERVNAEQHEEHFAQREKLRESERKLWADKERKWAEERAALNAPQRTSWFAPMAARKKAAEEKVREALAAAADSLPTSAPTPQALLKRR